MARVRDGLNHSTFVNSLTIIPKKRFEFKHLCHQCRSVYAPPRWFPEVKDDTDNEWKSVQIKPAKCSLCDTQTLFWVGTAEWANSQAVIDTAKNGVSGSKEQMSWSRDTTDAATRPEWNDPPEMTEVLTRSAPVCHDCVCSHEPDTVFEAMQDATQHYQVTNPMWEETTAEEYGDTSLTDVVRNIARESPMRDR